MTRVVKDPDVRREELIDIAEELFLKNGYEETPVSDIVKKAQVAQGTFYYYFKSKDEILDALADRYLREVVTLLEEQIQKDDTTALEKIANILKSLSTFNWNRVKLLGYLHEEKNALLHLKMERKSYPLLIPLFVQIIEQGIKEGLFSTKYPREAALTTIGCMDALLDMEHFFEMDVEERKRTVEAAFYTVERILGAEQGSLAKSFVHMRGLYGKQ